MGEVITEFLTAPDAALRAILGTVRRLLPAHAATLALTAVVTVIAGAAGRRAVVTRRRRGWLADARVVRILAPPEVDPAGGEALWAHLIGLLRPAWARFWHGQPHLAMEYVFTHTGLTIQVWVPGPIPPRQVEAAIQAAWPGAHTQTHHGSVSLLPEPGPGRRRIVLGGQLRLARTDALPLRTAFDAEPLRALVAAPAGLDTHETVCVQVCARPATGRRRARTRRAARRLHHGGPPHLAGRLLDLLTPSSGLTRHIHRPGATFRPQLDPVASRERSAQASAVAAKDRGSAYDTVVRYAVATTLPTGARHAEQVAARRVARGRAHAIAAAAAVFTDLNHYTRRRLRDPAAVLAQRRLGRGDLLSVPELAALAHLPTDDTTPGLRRAGARAVPPPPGVADTGRDVKPLGDADSGRARPIGLRVADARQHLHIVGSTGSGKSTLLAQLILNDAAHGRGAVVIDPRGDLITDILDRLPRQAAEQLVLFDADTRRGRIPCLNPLDGGDVDREVDNLTSVFRGVFAAYWGPRTDDVMRAAALTLRAQPGITTLADIPKLLTDDAYRARAANAAAVQANTDLALFWRWYAAQSDAARSVVISPLLNKLRSFLLRPFPRAALAGGANTVDMTRVLDGGLLLARIPKGLLGEDTCRLIGSLIVARTWQAATARAAIGESQRRDAGLYIDECHNFLHLPHAIEDMLAEARGYRLAMTLAHQHLRQLPRELADALNTNARSKIFFTASPDDAAHLARHTQPQVSEHDLAHLGAYRAAARLVVNSEHTPAFTLATRPLPPVIPGRARHARRLAQRTPPRPHDPRTGTARPSTDPRRAA